MKYTELLQQIINSKSMTIIDYTCENAAQANEFQFYTDSQKETLEKIYSARDLDTRWLIAYRELGLKEKATEIEKFQKQQFEKQTKNRLF